MNEEAMFILVVVVLLILFIGDPDLHDALLTHVTKE